MKYHIHTLGLHHHHAVRIIQRHSIAFAVYYGLMRPAVAADARLAPTIRRA